ncbi:MAG: phosphate ABC transporter permease subunit PstC [Bacteroidota bacterium]
METKSKVSYYRINKNRYAKNGMMVLTILACSLIVLIVVGLTIRSAPILFSRPLSELLFSTEWKPFKGQFGFAPFIVGTFAVTGVAVVIAVPLCLLTAIYLSEYASSRVTRFVNPFIDVLSGIPSIIFGVWGILLVVPFISKYIAPLFNVSSNGYTVLAGGLVLSIMIFPIIINVLLEVFKTVPNEMKDASLSLGATKWQTVKKVLLKRALPGVIAAFVLGLSRAFGETMAVLMVTGNVSKLPKSLMDPTYTLPSLIANNYGEMLSIPMYDSALLLASLILLMIILFFNIISRIILVKIERNYQ